MKRKRKNQGVLDIVAMCEKHRVDIETVPNGPIMYDEIARFGLVSPMQRSIDRSRSGASFFGAHSDTHSIFVYLVRDGKGGGDFTVTQIRGDLEDRKNFVIAASKHSTDYLTKGENSDLFTLANITDTTRPHQ